MASYNNSNEGFLKINLKKNQWRSRKDATAATGVRTYMVQVMFGCGIPSTKHSSETLVSGPARTCFSSSFRYTLGGTAKFKFEIYSSGEYSNHFHTVYKG